MLCSAWWRLLLTCWSSIGFGLLCFISNYEYMSRWSHLFSAFNYLQCVDASQISVFSLELFICFLSNCFLNILQFLQILQVPNGSIRISHYHHLQSLFLFLYSLYQLNTSPSTIKLQITELLAFIFLISVTEFC